MQIQKIGNNVSYRGNAQIGGKYLKNEAETTTDTNVQVQDKTPDAKNKEAKKEFSPAAALGALAGALIPVFAISKATKGKLTFDIFENDSLKKDLATVLTVSTSAILGGLLGGLTDAKTPEDKKAKVKESLFDITTVAIPTTIATSILGIAKKMKVKNIAPKIIAPLAGIGLGMPLAQKASGVIDKFLNRDNPNFEAKERKLKPQDYIVHIDDLLALLIISKVPFANKIHADKLLPLIYAWCGFESGSKTADSKEGH